MVSSNNNFKYDLQFGQIREKRVAAILLNEKIEVKTERGKWSDTKNIAIERSCRGKPSGLASTEASYWLHILEKDGIEICSMLFRTDVLKQLLNSLENPQLVMGGDDNASELVLVSLLELVNLMIKINVKELVDGNGDF